jgi:hypothetical protein
MDPKRIGMIVAILAVVGIAVYYFILKDQTLACTEITEKDACKLPCKWDQYFGGGMGRCVDKETELTKLEPAQMAESPTPSAAPSSVAPAPSVETPDVSGLQGHYTAESYSTSQKLWKDGSGNVNDVRVAGDMKVSDDGLYVYGGAAEKFTLPDELFDRQYTIIAVAKYNGDSKRRIFTSSEGGWFTGHNAGKSGVAYHDNWITEDKDHFGDDWVLSVDQRNLYRANGRRYSGYGLDESFPKDIGVNIASGQESDYAIAEIMVYDRELGGDEILKIEQALMDKYSISERRFAKAGLFTAYTSDPYRSDVDCGPTSGLTGFKLDKNTDNKTRYQYNCMFSLDQSGDAIDLTTEYKGKTDNFYDSIMDETLDCGARPIQAYKFDVKNSNETQVQYKCTDSEVDENTCRDVTSTDQDINTLTAHDIQCEDNEVMTYIKFQKSENDANKTRYVYKCCKPKGY